MKLTSRVAVGTCEANRYLQILEHPNARLADMIGSIVKDYHAVFLPSWPPLIQLFRQFSEKDVHGLGI